MPNTQASSQNNICPICGGTRRHYLFVILGLPVARCPGCDLLSVFPFPTRVEYHDFYRHDRGAFDPAVVPADSVTEIEAAAAYVEQLKACEIVQPARLLLIAPPAHPFAGLAQAQGLSIDQHVTIEQLEDGLPLAGEFDAAVILFQLEKAAHPDQLLMAVSNALTSNGRLLLLIPSLDSFSARILGRQWTEWRPENRYYFNRKTVQLLLWRLGFEHLEIENDRRKYTLDHIYARAKTFPRTFLTRTIRLGCALAPRVFHHTRLRLPTSAMIVTARKGQPRATPVCSMIVPAYNESATFSILMDALLNMPLAGLEKEIVIVESNSSDGTREQVLKYQDCPGVKIVLQESARGKGHAVREGFAQASGEIVLIQDADLEYDLNDYESLLEPVAHFRVPFVLGARHGAGWKMRVFEGQQGLSQFMNFGHIFFATLLNVLYGQHMQDPFTMFKVFRRDCLYNLKLECNRFDFDFELVIKLIRKGYVPLEIPVNYHSRSFREGKKVNVFRDPLTWLKAAFKYRFAKITRD
jgi:SAM-dependent methyltransferase